jgi:acyl carrier protein
MTALPNDLLTRFNNIIIEQLGLESPPPHEATFEEMDYVDSLDIVELTLACEEEFDIDISDDDFANVRTPGDLLKIVKRKLAAVKR